MTIRFFQFFKFSTIIKTERQFWKVFNYTPCIKKNLFFFFIWINEKVLRHFHFQSNLFITFSMILKTIYYSTRGKYFFWSIFSSYLTRLSRKPLCKFELTSGTTWKLHRVANRIFISCGKTDYTRFAVNLDEN